MVTFAEDILIVKAIFWSKFQNWCVTHLAPGGLCPGQLNLALEFVDQGQRLGVPVLRVVLVFGPKDDGIGRIPEMTHEDLAGPDEAVAGRDDGGARGPRSSPRFSRSLYISCWVLRKPSGVDFRTKASFSEQIFCDVVH